jgi:hypothetical protein
MRNRAAVPSATSGIILSPYTSGSIYIANHEEASEAYAGYHGNIAELLIYGRSLTAEEFNEVGFAWKKSIRWIPRLHSSPSPRP